MSFISIFKKLGPGLLYAAAAIGVSHLVQSTRAGADFGHQLIWAVVLANLFKYPFFQIAPKYTAITGKSLLHGYKEIGHGAVYLFITMTLGTMLVIQGAVTIVTAGLAINLFGLPINASLTSAILLLISAAILVFGKYHILDRFIKFIIILLTITTLTTLICGATADFTKPAAPVIFSLNNKEHIFFLIALIGWMPGPMDIPVWHSMWSMAKSQDDAANVDLKSSLIDFNIGYIGTAVLAVCFLAIGSMVMYRSGIELSASAVGFSAQLIHMYTSALGHWSFPLIATAAFTTMFSTTLTCLDAFPRTLTEALIQIKPTANKNALYLKWLVPVIAGTLVILFVFTKNMKTLVDFATTMSFVVAPIYAYLNYRVMFSPAIPAQHRPGPILKRLSQTGIVFFSLFSLYFIYIRFISH